MADKQLREDYETPRVVDHGDLVELTAAGAPTGVFDANYSVGQQIPPGGPGVITSQP